MRRLMCVYCLDNLLQEVEQFILGIILQEMFFECSRHFEIKDKYTGTYVGVFGSTQQAKFDLRHRYSYFYLCKFEFLHPLYNFI